MIKIDDVYDYMEEKGNKKSHFFYLSVIFTKIYMNVKGTANYIASLFTGNMAIVKRLCILKQKNDQPKHF